RVVGLVVGGVGIVGLGVAAAFAVSAKSQYNTSLGNCESNDPNVCSGTGVTQRNNARTAGNVASVAASVGAAALVGGAVIWLTAPRSGSSSAAAARVGIAPTLGGAVLQGAW
ncbi:MAG: tetratricopeptide repeat protein, partial [Polyangiaceae bacterium]